MSTSRQAWYESKVKAKLTGIAILLVTISYYACSVLPAARELFSDYVMGICFLVGAFAGVDAFNTNRWIGLKEKQYGKEFSGPGSGAIDTGLRCGPVDEVLPRPPNDH